MIQKPVKISLVIVINIITVILTVTGTYFIANAQQDENISKNKANISIEKVRINENTDNIYALKIYMSSFNKSDIAVMKDNLKSMKDDIKALKENQKEFTAQQNIFYQKLAAKLGMTFTK